MRVTLLILALLTAAPALAEFEDYSWVKPGYNVEPGRIYIKVVPEAAPLQTTSFGGIAMTGIPTLDAVADAFGVHMIEKAFMMEKSPDDPETPDLSLYYLVSFPEGFGPIAMIEAYNSIDVVEFAEFSPIHQKLYDPNDPRIDQQWHLKHCGFQAAWNVSHGSEDIVIGIIDGGIDMDADGFGAVHEDLLDNLWVNPGEDLNGDGVIDWDEWNERDDDQNGKPDDFYGWDFTRNDNWPDDDWGEDNGHGTHVAGIVSAVTDNETGIASAAFSCKLMITAHYNRFDPEGGLYNALQGIEYCARNGADVMNFSWGSLHSPYQAEEDVIEYALSQGAILFAGVGNDDVEDRRQNQSHFYPAAYDGVIGVGATSDERDRKASFSNYGDYTDLVAPGETILSTFPRNEYRFLQGTSMSSPLAAGLGALMLSVLPDLSGDELLEWMQRTAVDISDLNEDYPGITYRINADFLLNSTHPDFQLLEWSIRELEGDLDGYFEREELMAIDMHIGNSEGYTDAHATTILLETDDPCIRIERGEVQLGDLDNGEELELEEDQVPTFRVTSNSPIQYTTLTLTIDSEADFPFTFELPLTIGHPLYLLVDDDGGSGYESYYQEDLLQRPIVHHTWTVTDDGLPTREELNGFSFLIWMTGNAESSLSPDEQTLIRSYLENGGCLLLSSQFAGDDIGETDFHREVLHAGHLEDDVNDPELNGSADNPVSCDVTLLLLGGNGAGNGRVSPSSMEPLSGAEVLFTYNNTDDAVAGIYYHGDDYTLVYLGFALEAASGMNNTTPRHEFVERVLDHFYELGMGETPLDRAPSRFDLSAPWPNPFNASATVRIDVPVSGLYSLDVFDLNGRRVTNLHRGFDIPGSRSFTWNGDEAPAGVYLFRLSWPAGTMTRKVVLLK